MIYRCRWSALRLPTRTDPVELFLVEDVFAVRANGKIRLVFVAAKTAFFDLLGGFGAAADRYPFAPIDVFLFFRVGFCDVHCSQSVGRADPAFGNRIGPHLIRILDKLKALSLVLFFRFEKKSLLLFLWQILQPLADDVKASVVS